MSSESLFPRPRKLEWLGGQTQPDALVREARAGDLAPESYVLSVRSGAVELDFADDAGRRFGLQTFEQLRRGATGALRDCRVEDGPDFATRGYMLDISRDRVPTRECLEWLVKRLSALRYNHLQLYTEHTFAYAKHEPVWRNASPITPDDVRWLDDLCAGYGIELAANQNTFGHMERWLAHDAYRERAETPDGFAQGSRRRAPTALAPTPENAEFALELVRELLPHFRSRRINIGCDEVWELGQGASAEAVKDRGKASVFVEHLRRLAEPLLADGYDVQFWADMLQRAPAEARPLAEAGAVAAVWGYEAPLQVDPSTIDFDAMPEDIREIARDYIESSAGGFGPRLAAFAEAGFETWVVPGTSGWNSFVGRHGNARANLLDAAEAGREHGATGVLVTEWGDNGHLQPPFVTLPALAYGGATTWCRATNGDLDDEALAASVSALCHDDSGRLGQGLVKLGAVGDVLGLPQPNGTQLFYGVVRSGLPIASPEASPEAWQAAGAQLEAGLGDLAAASPQVEDGALLVRESRQAGALARYGLYRLAARQGFEAGAQNGVGADHGALVDEQRACWLARSRPGGLEDSLRRLRAAEPG